MELGNSASTHTIMLSVSIFGVYLLGLIGVVISMATAIPTLTFDYDRTYTLPRLDSQGNEMDFIAGKLERTSIHIHCHLKRYPTHNILTTLAPGTPGRSSRANHDRTCNNVQINYISLRYVPNIYEIKHSGPSTTTLGYCASQHVRANSDTMHQEVWGGIRRFGVAVNAQAKTPPAPPVRDPPLAQIVGYPDALDARFS